MSLFEDTADVLDRCGGVGLIHIRLIHQKLNVSVMGQRVGNILLGVLAGIPSALPAVILISGQCSSG